MNASHLMMRTNRLLFGSMLAATLVLHAELAPAAEFELLSDTSLANATPADTATVCRHRGGQAAANDSGGVADVDAEAAAAALGSDDSCNQSASATAKGAGLFRLVETMGEDPGDPVEVCIIAQQLVDVESVQNASASHVSDRIVASVVGGGLQVAIPKKSFKAEGDEDITVELECHRQFTMRIGESLQLSAGGTSKVTLAGIGGAEAVGEYEVEAKVGICENGDLECDIVLDSPAFTELGMTALGLLLPVCGGLVLRRRHRRSAA
jgi:hypothetical protein